MNSHNIKLVCFSWIKSVWRLTTFALGVGVISSCMASCSVSKKFLSEISRFSSVISFTPDMFEVWSFSLHRRLCDYWNWKGKRWEYTMRTVCLRAMSAVHVTISSGGLFVCVQCPQSMSPSVQTDYVCVQCPQSMSPSVQADYVCVQCRQSMSPSVQADSLFVFNVDSPCHHQFRRR